MEWTQKNAVTINKFSTEKERKKDMKTIYQIKQVYCEQTQLFMSPFPPNVTCLDFTLSNGFCQMKIKNQALLDRRCTLSTVSTYAMREIGQFYLIIENKFI